MACPLQAYFQEYAELPRKTGSKATFGSCIHKALEYYNTTGDLLNAKKLFVEAWDDPSTIGLPAIDVWNKFNTYGGLRQRGLDILDVYDNRMEWEQRTVIATEHKFLVPFGRHELTGTVDMVSVRKNHKGTQLLTIEDFKTNAKRPSVAELALNIQFTTYIYAMTQREFWFGNGEGFPAIRNADWYWELLKDMPKRGLWIQLWDNAKELDAGGRDQDDFNRLYRLCEEIERAVTHKVFVPNIGDACTFCDYAKDPCPVEPPSRDWWENHRLEEDENSWA
jgi:hypothetical protein